MRTQNKRKKGKSVYSSEKNTCYNFLFVVSCFILTSISHGHETKHLIESHSISDSSNSVFIKTSINQAGIKEKYIIHLYNSDPYDHLISIELDESEETQSNSRHVHTSASLKKTLTFFPHILSGEHNRPSLKLSFENPTIYSNSSPLGESLQQYPINLLIGAVWDSTSLIIYFQKNKDGAAQEINLTDFAKKMGIPLHHIPKITKVDVYAIQSNGTSRVSDNYQATNSIALKLPSWFINCFTDRQLIDSARLYKKPTEINIFTLLAERIEQLNNGNLNQVYIHTPHLDLDKYTGLKAIKGFHSIWSTADPKVDDIYDKGLLNTQENSINYEETIYIDDNKSINLPAYNYATERTIHLKSINPTLDTSWIIKSNISRNMKINHKVCEIHFGKQQNCIGYAERPFNLNKRLVLISQEKGGKIMAYLGPDSYDHIELSALYPKMLKINDYVVTVKFKIR